MVFCEKCDGNHSEYACVEIKPRKQYSIVSEPGESGYSVAIFRKSEVEAAYGPITPDKYEDTIARLVGWGRSYGGPGRGFSADPYMRVFNRNIIIRQFSGLDI